MQRRCLVDLILKLGLRFTCVTLAVLGPSTALQEEVTVRGRVERQVPGAKQPPVPYIRVTLTPNNAGADSRVQYTDAEGMYYFPKTKPGSYILKVWGDPKERKLLFEQKYDIAPKNPGDRYFDIKRISIR
jgi:hypothetical protein